MGNGCNISCFSDAESMIEKYLDLSKDNNDTDKGDKANKADKVNTSIGVKSNQPKICKDNNYTEVNFKSKTTYSESIKKNINKLIVNNVGGVVDINSNYTVYKDQLKYIGEEPWSDDLFSTNIKSIFGDETHTNQDSQLMKLNYDDVIWLRAEDICEGEFSLFGDGISPDDIIQGILGNCYFLAALSSLAKYPSLVLNLFNKNTLPSKNSCYEVLLRINGEWNIVYVDDWFPCYKSSKKPLFAKSNNCKIWVMLLEKAWAKVNGSWSKIERGTSKEAFTLFTDFYVKDYNIAQIQENEYNEKTLNTLNDVVMCLNEDKNIICLGTNQDISKVSNGIKHKHSYSILKIISTSESNSNTNTFESTYFILRDPHRNNTKILESNKDINLNLFKNDEIQKFLKCSAFIIDAKTLFSSVDSITLLEYEEILTTESVKLPIMDNNKSSKLNSICPFIFKLNVKKECDLHISGFIDSMLRSNYSNLEENSSTKPNTKTSKGDQISIVVLKAVENNFINDLVEEDYNTHLDYSKLECIENKHSFFEFPEIKCRLNKGVYLISIHAIIEKEVNVLFNYNTNINNLESYYLGQDADFSILRIAILKLIKKDEKNNFNKLNQTKLGGEVSNLHYGYFYYKNTQDKAVNLKIIDNSFNFIKLYPVESFGSSASLVIQLPPVSEALYLICLDNTLEKGRINFKYSELTNGTEINNNILHYDYSFFKNDNKDNYQSCTKPVLLNKLKFKNKNSYKVKNFVGTNIDQDSYANNIDIWESTKNYYLNKYPKLVNELLLIPELHVREEIRFADIIKFENGDWKFGEVKKENTKVFHGRVICTWAEKGDKLVGYCDNDEFSNLCTCYYGNGDVLTINYLKGKREGKGILTKKTNEIYYPYYEDGIFSRWITN